MVGSACFQQPVKTERVRVRARKHTLDSERRVIVLQIRHDNAAKGAVGCNYLGDDGAIKSLPTHQCNIKVVRADGAPSSWR